MDDGDSCYQTMTLPDGQPLAYVDVGEGLPMLLMHGFTGTATSHCGALLRHWRGQYRVIAPDMRGYGRSQPPGRSFPADFYEQDVRDMVSLIDHLALPPVLAVGFSDGAENALLLAARAPERVRAAVGWGVSGVMSRAMVEAVQRWLPAERLLKDEPDWVAQIVARHGEAHFPSMVEGWVRAAEAIYAGGGNICLAQASAVRCPTLLLNGVGEVGNTRDDLHRLAAQIADVTVEIVAGAGHAIHQDRPREFTRRVDAFLQRLGEA